MNSGTDKQLVKKRFEANFKRYDRLAHVQQRICCELAVKIREFCGIGVERAFEIGAGTGFLTNHLLDIYPQARWFLNDLVPAAENYLTKYVDGSDTSYLWGDAEEIEFPDSLDMIASASTVQWFDDLPRFAEKATQSLKKGGVMVLSTFGRENFKEIRRTTGEGLEYFTLDELEDMMTGAGYETLYSAEYAESLRFDTPADVLRHIKYTGVNSLRKTSWSKGRLVEFEESYRSLFSAGDGVTLTYHPILIVVRKV